MANTFSLTPGVRVVEYDMSEIINTPDAQDGMIRWDNRRGVTAVFHNGEWHEVGFYEDGKPHPYLKTEEDKYLYRIGYESENR